MTDQTAAPAQVVGVIGAGTMGAGIAQLACRSGARTLLFDADVATGERASTRMRADFDKLVGKGKLEASEADAAYGRLELVSDLAALAACELVVEAIPESLPMKRDLVASLDAIVSSTCVIATNTSSLLVAAIAAGSAHPGRVAGMHFFNPPPVMRLLEVVAGEDTNADALAVTAATGEAMGKSVIIAKDGPGFIVNRTNRPYLLEALKSLSDGLASIEDIDKAMRLGGGFRMGPFELSDLVGIDVGLEVAKSFYDQSFGEPRWRPSPIAERYVAAGKHGRKSQRGYYDYRDGDHRPADPPAPESSGQGGRVAVVGDGALADALRDAAAAAGWAVGDGGADLVLDCRSHRSGALPDGPRAVLCDVGSLRELDETGRAVGFHALAPFDAAKLVELTRRPGTPDDLVVVLERFFGDLGKHTLLVGDAPGLVLGRIVSQIVNEACFAVTEGVGSHEDVDTGLVLALNHPRGPFAWADAIGVDRVLGTLEALQRHTGDDRYRPAPLLKQVVADADQAGSPARFFAPDAA